MEESFAEQGILDRPRIHSLIEDGLQYPLLIMLAGPGYGKTQAMTRYVEKKTDSEVLWLRLTDLDNISTHFWTHLVQSLRAIQPNLSNSLQTLGFPDNLSSFDAFIRLLEMHTSKEGLLWVLDDFGNIHNKRILDFLHLLASSNMQSFNIVLMTNDTTNLEHLAYLSSRQHIILQKDLRFSQTEIAELYSLYNLSLEPDELNNIEQQTEGWPLSLHLLVQQQNKAPETLSNSENAISYLFEARYFSSYSQEQRKVLLRLSLLNYFTMDLAVKLYPENALDVEDMIQHSFVSQEATTGRLFLHYLYGRFLKRKQYFLTDHEKQQTWGEAALHYQAAGDTLEAIACFSKCKDYEGMVKAMADYVKAQRSIVDKNAVFLTVYIDMIPPEELSNYPVAQYLLAWIWVSSLQLDKAEALSLELKDRYLQEGLPDSLSMLGEVYVLLGLVHAMRGQYDFGDYFEKAAEYLPDGSQLLGTRGVSTLLNNHNFSLANNRPGSKEEMEKAAHYGMPRMALVMNGCNSGTEHIFSAEAAYLSFELDDATEHAYRTIYSAQAGNLHDLVCNGHYVLAQIGLLKGSFEQMTEQVMNIEAYSIKHDIASIKEISDTALAWYYLELHDYAKIPRSILSADYFDKPVMSYGRVEITYAHYLLHMKEYAKLVGMLEHPRGFFIAEGIRYDRIYLYILLAIGYSNLGNNEAAIEALWTAYNMCYDNGLITPFIEARRHLQGLLKIVQRQDKYTFDPAWCKLVSKEAEAFAERSEAVLAVYEGTISHASDNDNPLTRREREVLLALSQGLTREEISLKQFVSVNTLKSTIRNIYLKLDAKNRAEAVSIAMANGYI